MGFPVLQRGGTMRWIHGRTAPGAVMIITVAPAILTLSGCGGEPLVEGPSFSVIQPELFSTPGALTNAWADFDRDGDPDLFVGFNGSPNRLYRNDEGTFFDVAPRMGVDDARGTRTSAWGDFDSDGDPDLLLGFVSGEAPILKLYRNDGGAFVDVAAEMGLALLAGTTRQASWIDFDADGDLDLFLAFRDRSNALFLNEDGHFRDVAQRVGVADPRRSVGAVWFDFEEDGDLDLLVANMDGDANGLFRNDGGMFVDVAPEVGLADGGRGLGDPALGTVRPCLTDFDNDGTIDLFFANYGPNALFRSGAAGRWRNVAPDVGLAMDGRYDTCAFGDFDNDGQGGPLRQRDHNRRNPIQGLPLPKRTGLGSWTSPRRNWLSLDADHGAPMGGFGYGWWLDLALAGATEIRHALSLRNLPGPAPAAGPLRSASSTQGVSRPAGAEVRIYEQGTGGLLGTRVVDTGSGYDSQNVLPVYFGLPPGLPDGGHVDIRIQYPAAGARRMAAMENVDPRDYSGRAVTLEVAAPSGTEPSPTEPSMDGGR